MNDAVPSEIRLRTQSRVLSAQFHSNEYTPVL